MWITLTDPSGDPVRVNLDQCERVVPNGKDLHGGLYDSNAKSIVGRAGGRDTPVKEPFDKDYSNGSKKPELRGTAWWSCRTRTSKQTVMSSYAERVASGRKPSI